MSDVEERKPHSYLPVRLNRDIPPILYGEAHRLLEADVPMAEEPFRKEVSGPGL